MNREVKQLARNAKRLDVSQGGERWCGVGMRGLKEELKPLFQREYTRFKPRKV